MHKPKFTTLNPKWTIEPADLAEVVPLNPSLADDSGFQKIQEQVTAKALASFAQLQRGMLTINRIGEISQIAARLPGFLTTNRWELAAHLWVANGVFQHNLAAMATLHRLKVR